MCVRKQLFYVKNMFERKKNSDRKTLTKRVT